MAFDQNRYFSLIQRAAFDASFYKGTIQDLSSAQRAMSFVGAPTFGRVNGHPCLKQNATGEGCTSGAVLGVVDMAASWTIETLHRQDVGDSWLCRWAGPASAGGFLQSNFAAGGRILVYEYDAAGVPQRQLFSPAGGVTPPNKTLHTLTSSIAAGTSGRMWFNGIPQVVTLIGAGVPVNPVASPVGFGMSGGAGGLATEMILRVYPFALTNEDATCLAEAAKELVGGW